MSGCAAGDRPLHAIRFARQAADPGVTRMPPVLQISDLSTHIQLTKSVVHAVGNVDLTVEPGEALGLVGESGCGKSMTGLSIMGLLPQGGKIVSGSIKLDGRELVGLREAELRTIRGNEIAMIFQDPLTSLDPTKTIGYQVAEPVRLHKGASKAQAMARATEVLGMVGLPRPAERLGDYPHQLSGGMRQRVMIAMALSCEPKRLSQDGTRRLLTIGGLPPDLSQPPAGCRFAPRCSRATEKCLEEEPALTGERADHVFSCWHPVDGPAGTGAAAAAQVASRAAEPDGEAAVGPVLPLLEVRDLVKEFPVTAGAILQRKV